MTPLRRDVRRVNTAIDTVRLDLDTKGFTIREWGAMQRRKKGDWVVNNDGDGYAMTAAQFEKLYRPAR